MIQRVLLGAALLAVASFAWWLELTKPSAVSPDGLAGLPTRIEGFESVDIPVADSVADMLRADFNLQREYRDPLTGVPVWVYLGYYGTKRGGAPEHTPFVCYEAQGWTVESSDRDLLATERGLHANRMVVRTGGQERLVLFWYRAGARTGITSKLGLRLAHLRNRITTGRADGALVRLSTPLDGDDLWSARARLRPFAEAVDVALDEFWPDELGEG